MSFVTVLVGFLVSYRDQIWRELYGVCSFGISWNAWLGLKQGGSESKWGVLLVVFVSFIHLVSGELFVLSVGVLLFAVLLL